MIYGTHVNKTCNSIYVYREKHSFAYAVLRNIKILNNTAWTSFLQDCKQAENVENADSISFTTLQCGSHLIDF
jgi:hypothetical protein